MVWVTMCMCMCASCMCMCALSGGGGHCLYVCRLGCVLLLFVHVYVVLINIVKVGEPLSAVILMLLVFVTSRGWSLGAGLP